MTTEEIINNTTEEEMTALNEMMAGIDESDSTDLANADSIQLVELDESSSSSKAGAVAAGLIGTIVIGGITYAVVSIKKAGGVKAWMKEKRLKHAEKAAEKAQKKLEKLQAKTEEQPVEVVEEAEVEVIETPAEEETTTKKSKKTK